MTDSGYRGLLRRYARYAPTYERRFKRYTQRTLDRALELVPNDLDRDATLIDVACGTGAFEARLRQRFANLRIVAVDISRDMLEQARRRLAGDPRIEWIEGTAESLPGPDASADVLTCNNAFHLVRDSVAALREFRRVLKPGGTLVIVDWCRDFLSMRMLDFVQRFTDRQFRHVRSLEAFTRLLEQHGFVMDRAERFGVPPLWGLMSVRATRPAEAPAAPAALPPTTRRNVQAARADEAIASPA